MSYDIRSQTSSSTGRAMHRIQTRSCIDHKTCYWSGLPAEFDTYLIKLVAAFAQRGTQYLGNPLFFRNYLGDPNYIDSEICYDAYGLSA